MIFCPRCRHSNQSQASHCERCRQFFQHSQCTGLELQEGRAYVTPELNFENAALNELCSCVEEFLAGASEEPMFEALAVVRGNFEQLSETLPLTIQVFQELQAEAPDLEESHQILYLIQRGSQLFGDALSEVETLLLDGFLPEETLFDRLQEGSDYLAYSAVLGSRLLSA